MSKLIVLLRNYYPFPNAVGACAESIVSNLLLEQKSLDISIICEKTKIEQPSYEVFNRVKVYRFLTKRTKKRIQAKGKMYKFLNRIFGYLYDVFSITTGNKEMIDMFYNMLISMDVTTEDVVIPFCAPFESVIASLKAIKKQSFKLIPILYDLYSGCKYTNRNSINRIIKYPFNRQYEKKMEKYSTHILYSNTWERYLINAIKQKKATRVEVPLLFPRNQTIQENIFDKNMINVVYCGNFNDKIRKSDLFCKLFDVIFREKKNIVLHIIGNGNLDKNVIKLKDKYKENTKLYGYMPHDKAIDYLNQSQIIVVVGNEGEKQFPSKIVEALSFSKKIIIVTKKMNMYYDFIAREADCLVIDKNNFCDILKIESFLSLPNSCENYCGKTSFAEFTPKYTTSIIIREGKLNEK